MGGRGVPGVLGLLVADEVVIATVVTRTVRPKAFRGQFLSTPAELARSRPELSATWNT